MVVSNLTGHCVEHAHYPSTVPQVITSLADIFTFVQPQKHVGHHSELASERHDTVLTTNS